jgi:hypothetical protein
VTVVEATFVIPAKAGIQFFCFGQMLLAFAGISLLLPMQEQG